MNYGLPKLSDCIPLSDLFLLCFLVSSFGGSLMVTWWQNVLSLNLFVGYNTYFERLWTVLPSFICLYLVNVEYVGNGQVCILECKVLFILQELVPVSKGNMSPTCFLFFLLVLQSITFCMSSLLFDRYSNALSVCLVLVVNLLRQHLFLLLLSKHLQVQSECALLSIFLLLMGTLCLFSFCWCLVCGENDTFRGSSNIRGVLECSCILPLAVKTNVACCYLNSVYHDAFLGPF